MFIVAGKENMTSYLDELQRIKEAVKNVSDFVDDSSSIKKIYFDKILKKELKRLKQFLNPNEEYLGLAKQIINEFLELNFQITL